MRFGPYEVVDELARGGMGAVYAVVHLETGARYALKTLLPEAMGDEQERVRFMREARALAQLQHPNLVRVFSAESEGPRPYLVQELLPGGSLQDRILRQGPLPTEEAVALTLQVADALALAHSQGILHRDLKPANVLLAEDGSARLADFGLAKRLHGESIRLTKTGQLLGTPAFMAPEQANGLPSDERTDVYGLAAVLHALLSGSPPFQAKSLMGVLSKVMEEAPLPLTDQPRPIRRLVERGMAKAADQRQPSMRAFADELSAAAAAGEERSRAPLLVGLAALVGAAGLAGAVWFASRPLAGAPSPTATPSPSPSSTPDLAPSAVSSPTPEPSLALEARAPFPLTGGRPIHLAYSPDAEHLAVVSEPAPGQISLAIYEAKSGAPSGAPEVSGLSQVSALSGGGYVAGFKRRLLAWEPGGEREASFPQGTLESLAISSSGDDALVSLEEPGGLALYQLGDELRGRRLAVEGRDYGLVLWVGATALAVSSDRVRALRVEGGELAFQGKALELRDFSDPCAGMVWGSEWVFLGNGLGRVLALKLDAQGVPVASEGLTRQGDANSLMDLRAHTERVHTFLEAQDPPHVVSVARTHGDKSETGALARWRRDAKGAWVFGGDLEARAGQLCVTQGGRVREWVAAAIGRRSGAIVLEQTPSRRYLRR